MMPKRAQHEGERLEIEPGRHVEHQRRGRVDDRVEALAHVRVRDERIDRRRQHPTIATDRGATHRRKAGPAEGSPRRCRRAAVWRSKQKIAGRRGPFPPAAAPEYFKHIQIVMACGRDWRVCEPFSGQMWAYKV